MTRFAIDVSEMGDRHSQSEMEKRKLAADHQRFVIRLWSVILAAVALLCFVGLIMIWSKQKAGRKSQYRMGVREQVSQSRVAMEHQPLTAEQAIERVEQVLAAPSADSMRDTVRVTESSLEDFWNGLAAYRGDRKGEFTVVWNCNVRVHGQQYMVLEVKPTDFSDLPARKAYLVPDPEGKWWFDADGFMRTCVPSLEEIVQGSPKSAIVRVELKLGHYYNGEFADDQLWTNYHLTSPELDEMEMSWEAYARKGSPVDRTLDELLVAPLDENGNDIQISKDQLQARVTLRIGARTGVRGRQVPIFEVLSCEWAMPWKSQTDAESEAAEQDQ